jgi:hypothetical protein
MPWEDAEEKKKKQGSNNARLEYILQVYQLDYEQIKTLCHIAKQRKLWLPHWGNTVFTVKIPENNSQQCCKTHYIQMVQTHGSVQLSLGGTLINGVINADSEFLLQLMPDSDGTPREPTQTLLWDVFCMMEVKGRKVWICLVRGSAGKYMGYFSSMMELINNHVMNFVTCPGTQVYWWLRGRGCLAEDVNRMVRHCFMLDQQKKITKSKYVSNRGYAVLDETDSDNIINEVAGEGIYNTLLGLLDKERREATASKGYNASAIMFGEAKEGAVEAYNFSSSASITTLHLKNVSNSRSVTREKTLAKSVFSIATSKVTSDGLEEEKEEENDLDYNAGPATKPGVAIEGMQMLTRGRMQQSNDSMDKDNAPGDDVGMEEQESNHKEAAQLTKNMNAATANLKLSSLDGDQHDNNEEEIDSAINSENTINFYSEDDKGEDFLEANLDV